MISVKIMSRKKAKRESYRVSVPTVIISITDVSSNDVVFARNSRIKDVLRMKFDDECGGHINEMSVEQAQKIAEFVRKWESRISQIIVHCEAGVSRSAGVAAAIMKYIADDDISVFENPEYIPNMTCYRKVMEVFYGVPMDEFEIIKRVKTNLEVRKAHQSL